MADAVVELAHGDFDAATLLLAGGVGEVHAMAYQAISIDGGVRVVADDVVQPPAGVSVTAGNQAHDDGVVQWLGHPKTEGKERVAFVRQPVNPNDGRQAAEVVGQQRNRFHGNGPF